MSDEVFPYALPGTQVEISRTRIDAVAVQTSASGMEARAKLQATPRYRWEFEIQCRAGSVSLSSETDILASFYDRHGGPWDSFLFNDPFDGVQKRVRFEENENPFNRLLPTSPNGAWWNAKFKILMVK